MFSNEFYTNSINYRNNIVADYSNLKEPIEINFPKTIIVYLIFYFYK